MTSYTVNIISDVAGHQVVYDGYGPGVPMRIVSDVVLRHLRSDDGSCIRTDPVTSITTSEAELRSWPEFNSFEARLRAHLDAQITAMLTAQPEAPADPEPGAT